MFRPLAEDRDDLPLLLETTRRHAAAVLGAVDERAVVPDVPAPEPMPLAAAGAGLRTALEEFAERWEPAFSTSAGPRYLGFVTGGATPAALAGDWLTAVWDQNSTSSLDGAGQAMEQETVGWLRELFGLSDAHQGSFVSGATMSNTVGLAIAREWLGERHGVSPAEDGAGALGAVRVLSGAAHSSIPKALSMLGLGRKALVPVPTLDGREAVDPAALESALRQTSGPCVVVANAGTVNTVDFDDLRAIAALRERYDFWLHVDAAFGAFAALSPNHAHLVGGLDLADSICVDLHKWLNVPYDSAVQFTRRRDLQAAVFQSAAAYLGPLGDPPDAVHLTPQNSRRLRALATCVHPARIRERRSPRDRRTVHRLRPRPRRRHRRHTRPVAPRPSPPQRRLLHPRRQPERRTPRRTCWQSGRRGLPHSDRARRYTRPTRRVQQLAHHRTRHRTHPRRATTNPPPAMSANTLGQGGLADTAARGVSRRVSGSIIQPQTVILLGECVHVVHEGDRRGLGGVAGGRQAFVRRLNPGESIELETVPAGCRAALTD
jgi:pyridoxal-dependent decarboxylase-like protein